MSLRWIVMVGLLCCGGARAAQVPSQDGAYAQLVDAEHAFADRAAEVGVRDAFVEWFADDNLGFAPGPVAGRARWRARDALKSGAQWKPAFAEVSAAGDFGYTLGPHRWYPLDGPERTVDSGHFLSVWQRDADGVFRNVFDHGIGHVEVPLPAQPQRRGPVDGTAPSRVAEATRAARLQALLQTDRALAALDGRDARRRTVAAVADDLLLMREGDVPQPARALPVDDAAPAGMALSMLRIAASADLAATAGWNGDATLPAVYARVWRHDGKRWRLVVDLLRVQ